jgi:hypothetical protein
VPAGLVITNKLKLADKKEGELSRRQFVSDRQCVMNKAQSGKGEKNLEVICRF